MNFYSLNLMGHSAMTASGAYRVPSSSTPVPPLSFPIWEKANSQLMYNILWVKREKGGFLGLLSDLCHKTRHNTHHTMSSYFLVLPYVCLSLSGYNMRSLTSSSKAKHDGSHLEGC